MTLIPAILAAASLGYDPNGQEHVCSALTGGMVGSREVREDLATRSKNRMTRPRR